MSTLLRRAFGSALRDWRLLAGLLAGKALLVALAARGAAARWADSVDGAAPDPAPTGLPDLDLLQIEGALRGPVLAQLVDGAATPVVIWALAMALLGGGILARLARREGEGTGESFGSACGRCAGAFLLLLALEGLLAAGALHVHAALGPGLERTLANTKSARLAVWLVVGRSAALALALVGLSLYLGLARAHVAARGARLSGALLGAARTAWRQRFGLVLVAGATGVLWMAGLAVWWAFAASAAALSPALGRSALALLLVVQVASRLVLWAGEVELVRRG